MKTPEERLRDLGERVATGDRTLVVRWFRRTGNTPEPKFETAEARHGAGPTHAEHIVPVRVFADRLLDGTMRVEDVPQALTIVRCAGFENSLRILKLMPRGGPSPVYTAMRRCPTNRLVEVAAWRYLAVGIELLGVNGQPGVGLDDKGRIERLVCRYAKDGSATR